MQNEISKIIAELESTEKQEGIFRDFLEITEEQFADMGGDNTPFPKAIEGDLVLGEYLYRYRAYRAPRMFLGEKPTYVVSFTRRSLAAIEFRRHITATFIICGGTRYPGGRYRGRVVADIAPALRKARICSTEHETKYFDLSEVAVHQTEEYVATPTQPEREGWVNLGGNQLPYLSDFAAKYPVLVKEIRSAWGEM